VNIEPLAVPGAWLCTPRVVRDPRGSFLEWFRGDLLARATGRTFDIIQANHSVSRRGVVRGIHFADVPPGQAKFVYCAAGRVLDVVVDVRAGSPTYGQWCSVPLDAAQPSALFIAEGLGHAFCALTDAASVAYLISTAYDPAVERTVSPLDPMLGIAWPAEAGEPVLSDKDASAPPLAEALAAGHLPSYDACVARYGELSVG
jgi:dTDP-4-dehydrorhamnose 3,5-epimerase